MFVPPIVFDRNSQEVPALVRSADVLWAFAGISGLLSNIRPPTSVYSLSLNLVQAVGFWDAGPDAIGEDLHMYIKCFYATRGNIETRTIWAPASQCNVAASGDETGVAAFIAGYKARCMYSQNRS